MVVQYLSHRQASAADSCAHLPEELPAPNGDRCAECGHVSLRMCGTCGHVGCCESQAGHARTHALSEEHPIIHQLPVGPGFTWCYVERRYLG